MLKTFYIRHDYSARNDQKILQLRFKFGWEGYGLFWAICETMAEDTTGYINRGAIGGLSAGYGVAMELLQSVFDYCVEIGLFHVCEHNNYFNQRILEHKKERLFYSEKGILGNIKRWGNRPANRPANRKDSIVENRIDKIYTLYPSRDINDKNRSTGKCSKDKIKISKLLSEGKDLEKLITQYILDCEKTKTYLKNFSTFLNQLPETPPETIIPKHQHRICQ
jgi:hypothetical protein